MTQIGKQGAQVWRVGRAQRVFGWPLYVGSIFVAIALDLLITDGDIPAALTVIVVAALMIYLFAVRPRILLTSSELVVVNPVGSHVHDLREIVSAEPGWTGLAITTDYRRRLTGWAVQQPHVSVRRSAGRAERVACRINEAAADAREAPDV